MKIKNIEKNSIQVKFTVSPVFNTEELVKRCRNIVDDFFTFVKFDNYTQYYNFRKYCLNPLRRDESYLVYAVEILDLVYSDTSFCITCFRNGDIVIDYPQNMTNENKELFVTRMERMIEYAL